MLYEGVHVEEGAGSTGTQIACALLDSLLLGLPAVVAGDDHIVLLAVLEGGVDRPVDTSPPSALHMKRWVMKQGAAILATWGRAAGRLRQIAGEGTALEVLQAELAKALVVHQAPPVTDRH
jgi:hypothetical protein